MNNLNINLNIINVNDSISFNGTTIHYKDNRYICLYHNSVYCGLASCFLDFIDGKYHYVEGSTQNHGDTGYVDSRLVKYNGEYFISNTNFTKAIQTMHLRRLSVSDNNISIDNSIILGFPSIENFENYTERDEKNWCPFEYDGKFYYIYSLNPHRFLEVDMYGTGRATLRYETKWETDSWWEHQNWNKPFYRLNSSPIKLPDGTYLSTFHTMNFSLMDSLINKNIQGNLRSYWTGFYQFESKPPFRVLKISSYPFITSNLELPEWWPRQKIRATANPFFPFNLFLYGEDVIITGGSNDVTLAYCSINLEKILQSLEKVE
jgi:hypothetical protein